MISLYQKLISSKDKYFVFWVSLLFYLSLYFSLNNKTLLILFLLFILVFFHRLKDLSLSLLFIYLLFLPFAKGKSIDFVLIPQLVIDKWIFPYTFGLGITFADVAFMGLFILMLRDEFVNRSRKRRWRLEKSDIFLVGFLLFVFISVFNSLFQLVSYLAFIKLVRVVAAFFLVRRAFRIGRANIFLPMVLSASLIFEGAWASLQFILNRPLGKAIEYISGPFSAFGMRAVEELSFFRSQGTFNHPNTLGSFTSMMLLFLVIQIFGQRHSRNDMKIYLASFLFGMCGLVFSASRASWAITFIIGFLSILFIRKRQKIVIGSLIKKWFSVFIILIVIFLPFVILPRISHLYLTLAQGGGFSYRSYLIDKAWLISKEFPLGIGIVMFPVVLVTRFGFFSVPSPVHNLFLEILAESGIFSLLFFLLFLIFAYKKFFQRIAKLTNSSKFFLKTGAFFSTIGFLCLALFYPFFWSSNLFEYLWFFLGIMLY